MKYLVLALALLTLASGTAAGAATLHVLGSSRSSGDFAVTTTSAKKKHANALYVRGYGRDLSTMAVVTCSRGYSSIGSKTTELKRMTSGRLYRLTMPFRGGDCDVTASLSGSGSIRLQILG